MRGSEGESQKQFPSTLSSSRLELLEQWRFVLLRVGVLLNGWCGQPGGVHRSCQSSLRWRRLPLIFLSKDFAVHVAGRHSKSHLHIWKDPSLIVTVYWNSSQDCLRPLSKASLSFSPSRSLSQSLFLDCSLLSNQLSS